MKKDAQEIQDAIFKKMSANKKLALMAGFWRLAKDISGKKHEGNHRPTATPDTHS